MFQHPKQSRILATLLLSTLCIAPGFASDTSPYSFVGALSAGPMWENTGESQRINIAPGMDIKYKADESTSALGEGEIFLGAQYDTQKDWDAQFGIVFAGMNAATLEGDIYDGGPDSDYSYKLKQMRLAAKVKIVGDVGTHFKNWVSFSAGSTFNESYDYTHNSTLTTPNFSSHSTTAFTYSAGIGMQYVINPHWQVGLGYEFTDWGSSKLDDGLELEHFYTNGLLFNVTFVG